MEDCMGGFYKPGPKVGCISSCLHSIGQESVTWEAGKCSLPGSQGGYGNGFGEQLASSCPSHLEEEQRGLGFLNKWSFFSQGHFHIVLSLYQYSGCITSLESVIFKGR